MLNLYRRSVLGVAGIPWVERMARKYGWRLGVGRFVAGETWQAALPALLAVRQDGRETIVDVLGEYVREPAAARAMADGIMATVEGLAAAAVPPVISVKPTQLGLGIDAELAFELATEVALGAEAAGGRVCLDMEDHRFVDPTLALLARVRAAGARETSTVLQAYLHRTPDDLKALLASSPPGAELRVVKGAYREEPTVAIQDMTLIRRAFLAMCETAWAAGAKVNVATHDDGLIREAVAFVRGAGLGKERFELQMLYGIKPQLQARLAADGLPVRVYVPLGADWYGYYSRRLAERPANVATVLRGLFR